MKYLLLILVVMAKGALAGDYYECRDAQGNKLFSQTPCPSEYISEDIKTFKEMTIEQSSDTETQSSSRDYAQELSDSNKTIQLNRQIGKSQKKLQTLRESYDRDITKLQNEVDSIGGINARNRAQLVVDRMNQLTIKFEAERDNEMAALEESKKALNALKK
ncbi:MAG: DUF4124 domain-containing protein [Oleibacter sp.]|nr:DUF4124 domain-containing protein [Thalassolituus sp.]